MEKKVIIVCVLATLVISILFSVLSAYSEDVETSYTYNSKTIKNPDGTYTLTVHSNAIYLNKIVNLSYENDDLLLEWKSYKLKIKLKIKEKNKDKEKDLKDYKLKADLEFTKNKTFIDDKYKFSWKFKDTKNKSLEVDSFYIELEDLTPMNIENNGSLFYLPDGLILNLDDLIQNNFTIEKSTDKKIKIVTTNISDLSEIDLDPTINFNSSEDSYIRAGASVQDINYGSETTASFDDGSGEKALINFDLSSLPGNSTISSAIVYLYFSTASSLDVKTTYPILYDWTESEVTWNNINSSVTWDTAGLGTTDYNSSLPQTFTGGTGWRNFDALTVIQLVSNSQMVLNGWLLVNQDSSNQIFRTKEYTGTDYDPYLTIIYSKPDYIINLNSPSNNSNLTSGSIDFLCNATVLGVDSEANITRLEVAYSTNHTDNFYANIVDSNVSNGSLITQPNKTISFNWSTSVSDGEYYWTCIIDVLTTDGLTESLLFYKENKFFIDSVFPNLNITYPTNDSNFTTNNVYVNYTVNDTNLRSCWYTNDTGITNISLTCGENITGWFDGIHNITVYANDTSGNLNSSSVTFRTDSTPPSLTITDPEDLSEINYNTSIPLNYIVSDNYIGVNTCWYNLDNSANSTLTNCANTTFDASSGSHTVYLYSNDSFGNEVNTTSTFNIELTEPTITLNQPKNNTYWANGTNFYFNFTGNSSGAGLDTCELYGNWPGSFSLNYSWVGPNDGVMNFTQINLSEGTFLWNIKCNDTGGLNRFSAFNRSFTVDETFPSVSFSANTVAGSQVVTFSNTISDTNLNTSTCKYTVFNSSNDPDIVNDVLTLNKSFTCGASQIFIVSDFATYILSVYAKDLAGNEQNVNESFTVSPSTGSIEGGGGAVTETIIVESNKTFCGDGICQSDGNDAGINEDFYNCQIDCPGFNPDSAIFGCIDFDPLTPCIWEQLTFQYIALGLGIVLLIFSFSTVKSKGKQVPTYRYVYGKINKRKKPFKLR